MTRAALNKIKTLVSWLRRIDRPCELLMRACPACNQVESICVYDVNPVTIAGLGGGILWRPPAYSLSFCCRKWHRDLLLTAQTTVWMCRLLHRCSCLCMFRMLFAGSRGGHVLVTGFLGKRELDATSI